MSIRQGNKVIAGHINYHPDLFDHKWADHILNDASWLRADTFSWQSGAVYEAAYKHLSDDMTLYVRWYDSGSSSYVYTKSRLPQVGDSVYDSTSLDNKIGTISSVGPDTTTWDGGPDSITCNSTTYSFDSWANIPSSTETISGTTITFYQTPDGHKIVFSTQESNVAAIYNATGVAWYYILDTINQRFKLPRTKWGMTGLRGNVGDYVEAGLPNITGSTIYSDLGLSSTSGAFTNSNSGRGIASGHSGSSAQDIGFDASRSNSIYGNSTTVQPKATEMYLYFYVGNFTQTALENTAGLNASLFNGKADLDFGNTTMIDYVVEKQDPSAGNNYTWYRKYKSGWVEQGGTINTGSDSRASVSFPVAFSLTPQVFIGRPTDSSIPADTINKRFIGVSNVGLTGFDAWGNYSGFGSYWFACGIAA